MPETDPPTVDIGPAPGSADRKRLLARSHSLKARLAVGRSGLTPGLLEAIRQTFHQSDLMPQILPIVARSVPRCRSFINTLCCNNIIT